MASALPIFARANSGDAIASYDWLDISSGAGYRTYYATKDYNGTAMLITRKVDGPTRLWYYENNSNNAAAQKLTEINFDIAMKLPSIVSGNSFITFTHAIVVYAGATLNHRYFVINVYHVSTGGTETLLGTATTTDRTNSDSQFRELITMALATRKFAIGEIIRLSIEVWGSADSATNKMIRLCFDPNSLSTYSDQDGRTVGTDFTFDVPFKIDI